MFNLFFFDFLQSHRRFRSMFYLLQGGHQLRSRPRNRRGRQRCKAPSAPYLSPEQERTELLMKNITFTCVIRVSWNQVQSQNLVKISNENVIGFWSCPGTVSAQSFNVRIKCKVNISTGMSVRKRGWKPSWESQSKQTFPWKERSPGNTRQSFVGFTQKPKH